MQRWGGLYHTSPWSSSSDSGVQRAWERPLLQATQLTSKTSLMPWVGKVRHRVSYSPPDDPALGLCRKPRLPWLPAWNTNVFCSRSLVLGSRLRWAKPEIRKANNLWGMSCCDNIRHREKPDTCRLGYCQGQLWTRETEKPNGELHLGPLIRQQVVLMHLQFDSACN